MKKPKKPLINSKSNVGRVQGKSMLEANPLSIKDFEYALAKVSRRMSEPDQETKETSESDRDDDCNETQTH